VHNTDGYPDHLVDSLFSFPVSCSMHLIVNRLFCGSLSAGWLVNVSAYSGSHALAPGYQADGDQTVHSEGRISFTVTWRPVYCTYVASGAGVLHQRIAGCTMPVCLSGYVFSSRSFYLIYKRNQKKKHNASILK
jgi:hypothetical protein